MSTPPRALVNDQRLIKEGLSQHGFDLTFLTAPSICRAIADIAFDWISIGCSILLVRHFGWWTSPIAVAWIGNRQRALGNLLHEAGHRNLSRSRIKNDLIAYTFLSCLLFADLRSYREAHARHHAWLGNSFQDPDFISPTPILTGSWWGTYFGFLISRRNWSASALGQLTDAAIPIWSKVSILGWWGCILYIIGYLAGADWALSCIGLWMLSRATTFHLITSFREMCDHFGLLPGGVFSFTRDISTKGAMGKIVHPRFNGYHLTHHLLPAVPYHHLKRAHRVLAELPTYRSQGHTHSAYFTGPNAVVRAWHLYDKKTP